MLPPTYLHSSMLNYLKVFHVYVSNMWYGPRAHASLHADKNKRHADRVRRQRETFAATAHIKIDITHEQRERFLRSRRRSRRRKTSQTYATIDSKIRCNVCSHLIIVTILILFYFYSPHDRRFSLRSFSPNSMLNMFGVKCSLRGMRLACYSANNSVRDMFRWIFRRTHSYRNWIT